MDRNPFEETATAGGRSGYSRPSEVLRPSGPFDDSNREQAIMNQYQRQGAPGQHPNPRMRGMGGGLGGGTSPHELQHQDPSSARHWRSNNPRMRGMGGGLGGPQESAGLWQTWKNILERTGNEDLANQWLEGQQTAGAESGIGSTNEYQTAGLWQTWKNILERTGNEDLANQWVEGQQTALNIGDTFPLEGHGRKRPYGGTRDMGPTYEELETIPLDLQFDQWGYPIGQDDFGYIGAARGGLMSLRR